MVTTCVTERSICLLRGRENVNEVIVPSELSSFCGIAWNEGVALCVSRNRPVYYALFVGTFGARGSYSCTWRSRRRGRRFRGRRCCSNCQSHKHTHTHITDRGEGQRVSPIDCSARETQGRSYQLALIVITEDSTDFLTGCSLTSPFVWFDYLIPSRKIRQELFSYRATERRLVERSLTAAAVPLIW